MDLDVPVVGHLAGVLVGEDLMDVVSRDSRADTGVPIVQWLKIAEGAAVACVTDIEVRTDPANGDANPGGDRIDSGE